MAVVLHVPHASTFIPSELRPTFRVDDETLALEQLRLTDHFTDRLFELEGAVSVVCPVSRLLVDVERFEDDALEVMAGRGMGVLYERCSDGRPLRHRPNPDEREALLSVWYRPHHQRLEDAVQRALDTQGRCLLLDCHSFPSKPLPCDLDKAPDRPDICLGTDPFHTPLDFLDVAIDAFKKIGWRVAVNRPYAGTLIPSRYYRKDARVTGLMVELNRALYMCEDDGTRRPTYGQTKARLQDMLCALTDGWVPV